MRLKPKSRMLPMISLLVSILLVGILAPGSPTSKATPIPRELQPAKEQDRSALALRPVNTLDVPSPFVRSQNTPASLPDLAKRFSVPRQTESMAPPVTRQMAVKPPIQVERTATVQAAPTLATPPREVLTSRTMLAVANPSVPRTSHAVKTVSETTPDFVRCWPEPVALLNQLQAFEEYGKHKELTQQTAATLKRLAEVQSLAATECVDLFAELQSHASRYHELALLEDHAEHATAMMRLRHAIGRRLQVWEQVHQIAANPPHEFVIDDATDGDVVAALQRAASSIDKLSDRDAWRKYTLVDEAHESFASDNCIESERRELARRMIRRMGNADLTQQQQRFFETPEFVTLKKQLRRWTVGPVDYIKLLRDIEILEKYNAPSTGSTIAALHEDLLWTDNDDVSELATRLDTHYRNANIRVALSEQLINRVGPPPQRFRHPVDETIHGASVRGVSDASNRVYMRLIPDNEQVRFGIEAVGNGDSHTVASKGPVVFQNEGAFRYRVRKLLILNQRGLFSRRAEAYANSNNYVVGIQSEFDGVPFLGPIVRSIAMNQQEEQAGSAASQINAKLETMARSQLDREVQQRMSQAKQKVVTSIIDPLKKMKLDPTPIHLHTTKERAIIRYRVAGRDQIAANTPRPLAMSDSWASMQIHQSALNNFIEKLELNGRKGKIREFVASIAEKIDREIEVPEDVPEKAVVQFAKSDAVSIHCDDGIIRILLRVASLDDGRGNVWKNFTVGVNYVAEIDGLSIRMIRNPDPDDYIAIGGIRRLGHRLAITTIFSSLFAPSRSMEVMPIAIKDDARLQDLFVSQFDVTGGWIGIALSRTPQSSERLTNRNLGTQRR